MEFGIFGFLLVIMMLLRPQGLIPERRRRLELTAEIAAEDAQLAEAPAYVSGSTAERGRGTRSARHRGAAR